MFLVLYKSFWWSHIWSFAVHMWETSFCAVLKNLYFLISINLSVCPSIQLFSSDLFIHPSISHPSAHSPISCASFIYSFIHPSIHSYTHPSVHLFACQSISLYIYTSIVHSSLPVYLSITYCWSFLLIQKLAIISAYHTLYQGYNDKDRLTLLVQPQRQNPPFTEHQGWRKMESWA